MEIKNIRALQRPTKQLIRAIQAKESSKTGMIAAILPTSGEYFLGNTLVEAAKKGRQAHPDGIFYFIRIGYPTVDVHRGGLRRK